MRARAPAAIMLAGVVSVALLGSAQARRLAEAIVGNWNYGGGVVQVSGSQGSFIGTIVKQTTLQTCPHNVGEVMWRLSGSNGTYTGTHVGFGSTCSERESHPAKWIVNGNSLTFIVSQCADPIGSACGTDTFTLTRAPAVKLPWPKLPDPKVPLSSVSNGCGAGKASAQPQMFDTSTYRNSNNPAAKRYTVNFRTACNLHDAAYSGAKVDDPLNGGTIDTFAWTKEKADEVFLANMRKICDDAFRGTGATVALADCKGTGGKTSLGAESRYNVVKNHGAGAFRARPQLAGAWSGQGVTGLLFKQNGRSVTATWKNGDATGELRAIVISRDQDSVIQGFVHTAQNGVTTQTRVFIVANPKTPNALSVSGGGLPATLTR